MYLVCNYWFSSTLSPSVCIIESTYTITIEYHFHLSMHWAHILCIISSAYLERSFVPCYILHHLAIPANQPLILSLWKIVSWHDLLLEHWQIRLVYDWCSWTWAIYWTNDYHNTFLMLSSWSRKSQPAISISISFVYICLDWNLLQTSPEI